MRVAASWSVAHVALAAAAGIGAAASASAGARVYGIEHQVQGGYERVVVFADGELAPRYEEHAKDSAELVLEGATLDPSAPRHLQLGVEDHFLDVSVREQRGDAPRVVVAIRHAQGVTPRLVEPGTGLLALELPRGESTTDGLDLAGRDVPLRGLVERIARKTGTPVMFDETLTGNVTIVAQKAFSPGEALLLLDTLLLMKGLAAMPSPGGVRKVVRIEGAAFPFVTDLAVARGDEVVTTLLPLQHVQAATMVEALRPMLGQHTLAFAYAPTNSLILGGSAALITRLGNIVQSLDEKGADRLFIRRLLHADAKRTAEQIQDVFANDGLIGAWPDERTNSVSVRAKVAAVDAIREFLTKVDRPAVGRGQLHVIPVEHADPDKLAEILSALQSGDSGRIRAARGGAVDPVTGGSLLAGAAFSVVVDPPTHSLVVQAQPDTAAVLADVVAELDRIPRQVDVEVTVIEISTTRGVDLSFDFLLPLTDVNAVDDPIAFVSGMPSGSASNLFAGTPVEQTFAPIIGLPPVDKALLARIAREPVLVPVVVNGQVVPVAIPRDTAAITAQDQTIYTRMILRPRITVISGEENEIFVGDNVPILTAQTNSANPLQTSQNVERQDVGVVLRVRPTLGEKGGIVLDLTTEVSALAGSLSPTSANQGPTIRERTLTTTVRLDNDRVAVIGWHSGPASMRARTGTPWWEDIPVFGWLFRATNDVSLESNLIIMVAAWLDDPEVHALAHMLSSALQHEAPELAAPGAANRPTIQ